MPVMPPKHSNIDRATRKSDNYKVDIYGMNILNFTFPGHIVWFRWQLTIETEIQDPSTTIVPNGVENHDQTQCGGDGCSCGPVGYGCFNNASGGNHEHGQTYTPIILVLY